MNWQLWWIFLGTELVLSLSPGPAVLLVISQALHGGGWRGTTAALGILTANVVWFALSAVGIGAVLLAAGPWFTALKWVGAAYLVYLAWGMLARPSRSRANALTSEVPQLSARATWLRGLVLQLTNPKALVFFVALLPQFVDPEKPVKQQILILGVTSLLAEFPVLAAYAALAGRASQIARTPRYARCLDIAAAVLLVAAALGVVVAPS
jgi:homoserine/homoserine lactone efflux protein